MIRQHRRLNMCRYIIELTNPVIVNSTNSLVGHVFPNLRQEALFLRVFASTKDKHHKSADAFFSGRIFSSAQKKKKIPPF